MNIEKIGDFDLKSIKKVNFKKLYRNFNINIG